MDRAFAAMYARLSPAAERGRLGRRRRELVRAATGHVVDVGAGVGANLDHLDPSVARITLLEPSPHMARHLRSRLRDDPPPVPAEVHEAPGEAMPLADDSVDVVLCTLVLCTVGDVPLTLQEARRVLRPGGVLAVLEHVRGDGLTARIQDAVRPVWSFLGGGCDPSRPTRALLEDAGFDTGEVEPFTLPGLGPASPAIAGLARPR